MEKLIIKAAKVGDLAQVKALIGENASLLAATDADGSTPLHFAVWKGHKEVVDYLLQAGADVNAQNQNEHWGTTPLHAAAHANRSAFVAQLIEHGAEIHAADLHGNTPLHHTKAHNAKAAANALQKLGATR